jgi:catalase
MRAPVPAHRRVRRGDDPWPSGPVLLKDQHLLEKLARFDRERIPERVVHANGSGAYGHFEVTRDDRSCTRVRFLGEIGKRT